MADAGQPDALNPVERALVEHVESGEALDLADDAATDESAMYSWDRSRTIRSQVVRDILRGRLAPEPDPHGLRLRGARIAGRIDLQNVTSAVALELSDCLLDEGLDARDAHLASLALNGCRIAHATEPPLDAGGLVATVLTGNGTTVAAHCNSGAVRLCRAHLGRLSWSRAELHNDSGPALNGDSLQVEQDVMLAGGFQATGAGPQGAVCLRAARLSGALVLAGAKLRNDSGPALEARVLRVGHSMFLRDGFEAIGTGELGAVCLRTAHIASGLDCGSARLRNHSGPALDAGRVRVDHYVFLGNGFEAIGAGGRGAVCLSGAHFGGALTCTDAVLRSDSGTALNADRLRVEDNVVLWQGFEAAGGGDSVTVHLGGLRVEGFLFFDPARLTHGTDSRRRLDANGLSYTGIPRGAGTESWLVLLRDGTPEYAAQLYQQLAAAHRAAGHDHEARRILIEQRRAQLDRHALTGHGARAWSRLTGLTLGYGYQPWRALLGLLGTLVAGAVLAAVLGSHGGLSRVHTPATSDGAPCALVEQLGVGLDLGTPLIRTGARGHCDYTDTDQGTILAASSWGLRFLAWAFATLFIAGFTGAVRKT